MAEMRQDHFHYSKGTKPQQSENVKIVQDAIIVFSTIFEKIVQKLKPVTIDFRTKRNSEHG